jgi:mannose-6-phosphate isomerase-like protein (cupin superfamily)
MDEMRITIVPVEDIDEISLPNGSWSKMLLTGDTVSGIVSSLGFSVFTPGTELSMVSHDTEEVAYVVSGAGEIRTESGGVQISEGQAVHIPARLWHAVVNTGAENLVMVFGFPYPAFPPTERQ